MQTRKVRVKFETFIAFFDDKGELWFVKENELDCHYVEAIACFQAQYCKDMGALEI